MINNEQFEDSFKLTYSIWRYILAISVIGLVAILSFILLGNRSSPINSFIGSSVSFLILTICSVLILFKSKKWIWFFVLAFVIKLTIGLVHYLYFIDPSYFESTGRYKSPTFEYEAVFSQIISFAHEKIEHGILFFNHSSSRVTHPEILSFISIPFVYFGDYPLIITPINTFFSLLISMNIILIAQYKFQFDERSLKQIALLTAYFPITLITSLLWRDIVGLSLMSIGLTLIMFSNRTITHWVALIAACYLFYLQRTIYPLVLVMGYIINVIFTRHYQSRGNEILSKILTVIFIVVVLPFILKLGNTEANASMAKGLLNFSILILPLKLVVGLIGPFPWTQFLQYETIPAYSYQLQDYLQGTFNFAFVLCLVLSWKAYFKKDNLNMQNITGTLLIISGLFNSYMHMSYVAVGFMFLIPWLFTQINLGKFLKTYVYSLIAVISLNILVVSVLGNLGISSLWK